jgi:outer membrane protein OmpA-like peptidoglycan-associated protein
MNMAGTHIKTTPILIIAAIAALGLGKIAMSMGWVSIGILQSRDVAKATLPDVKDAQVTDVQPLPYPTNAANNCGDPIRSEIWAWNAQMGWLYSNGGIDTTKNSIAEKYGVCLHFNRQDDTKQMQNDLLACAKELQNSTECSSGVHFVTIMADGAGQFLAPLNVQLAKLCKDCTAEIVGTTGFSRGEDKLMGPEAWKRNPHSMLGDGLIAGVLRDGDWDTGMKFIGDNNMRNNPDEHTFDPDAVNWVNADDYIKAAEMYIAGYCEDRKVIKNGKLTGEVRNVCVKGVVTWTPGDVNIAEKKGGLVSIVSTKQYRSQMPSAVIGIRKWNKAHNDKVASMLAAALEGGDQLKAFPEALKRAGDISAKIYGEKDGSYWVKYYKGTEQKDVQGKMVDLGGSYADNMNDALTVFGLSANSNNNVKATYTVFAKIAQQQYPELFKNNPIPPYEQIATTAYLVQAKGLLDNGGSQADTQHYSADSSASDVVSDRNWDIQFATGSAALTPAGQETVREIKDQVAITGLTVVLNGHTDNTGDSAKNKILSEARARAVMLALQKMASADFPDERFRVHGYGPDKPIAENSTDSGRAKNRRVEIILAN